MTANLSITRSKSVRIAKRINEQKKTAEIANIFAESVVSKRKAQKNYTEEAKSAHDDHESRSLGQDEYDKSQGSSSAIGPIDLD